jgi:uncharacterized protein
MGILKRIHVRKRETFDSSATPKPGEEAKRPRSLAKLDLAALGEKIKAAADHAKENDPKELKRRIADLQKQLRERPAETVVETKIERVEVPVLKNGQLDKAHKLVDRLEAVATAAGGVARELAGVIGSKLAAAPPIPRPAVPRPIPRPIPRPSPQIPRPLPTPRHNGDIGRLPIGEEKVLAACIQYPDGLRREQLTVLTGYKRSSRDAYIQRLREKELVAVSGDRVCATDHGVATLPHAEPLPTGRALQDFWLHRLPQGERSIFEHLIRVYPAPMRRDELDELTGYKRSSRDAYLNRLAAKELVREAGRGEVIASDTLFEDQ